jgi:hypothetical protein
VEHVGAQHCDQVLRHRHVGREPGRDRAGLPTVEEIQRQTCQVREQVAADITDDAVRQAIRQARAQVGDRGVQDAYAHREPDQTVETEAQRARAARQDAIDDLLQDPRERDRQVELDDADHGREQQLASVGPGVGEEARQIPAGTRHGSRLDATRPARSTGQAY